METIINRVANSQLVTLDMEEWYPVGQRMQLDIKDWLYEGLVLREKDFREQVAKHDWSAYDDAYLAVFCSTDAIIPAWAFMLVTAQAAPHAKKVVTGSLETLETILYTELIQQLDTTPYRDCPVIIKGCSHKPIPPNAYLLLLQKLQPVTKSIQYGEACSSVPLYKRKR